MISIGRSRLEPDKLWAFVVKVGPELVLLMDVTDLSIDGFKIVRIEDILTIERRGPEEWFEHILRSEGIVIDVRAPFEVSLANWKSAIAAIKNRSRHLIVECEEAEDPFIIGDVRHLNARTLAIRYFDAVGDWELSDRVIPYSRITSVTFGDRYTALCGKYVREPD